VNAGLELDLNVEIQLDAQLQAVLVHGIFPTAVRCVDGFGGLEGLRGRGAAPGDFTPEHACVCDGPGHGLRGRLYAIEGLEFGDVSGVGVFEPLRIVLLFGSPLSDLP